MVLMLNIWKNKKLIHKNQHKHKISAELLYQLYEKALAGHPFSKELESYEKKAKELKLSPFKNLSIKPAQMDVVA